MSLDQCEKTAERTWREKGRSIAAPSSFLPSVAQDEVAAGYEGQGDDAGTQGGTGAGQRPAARAARAAGRLSATGSASLWGRSTRPTRGGRQATHTDLSR